MRFQNALSYGGFPEKAFGQSRAVRSILDGFVCLPSLLRPGHMEVKCEVEIALVSYAVSVGIQQVQ